MTDPGSSLLSITVITVVLFAGCVVCLMVSLFLRHRRLARERHARYVDEKWRPFCFAAMVNDLPADLPPLTASEARVVTDIWLDCVERIRGFESTHGLGTLATRLRLHDHLLPKLKSHDTDLKLQALLALGAMRDSRALPLATAMLDSDYPLMSLTAAKALLEIDPHNGSRMIMERLDNPGWPARRLGQLLKLVPAKILHGVLQAAIETWPAKRMNKLLELTHTLAESEFHQVANRIMQRFPDDPGVLGCILTLDDDPGVHDLAIRLSQHPYPALRQTALAALGRVGTLRDRDILLAALNDGDWKQQQTAARALAQLPGLRPDAALEMLNVLRQETACQHWREALFLKGWLHNPVSVSSGVPS